MLISGFCPCLARIIPGRRSISKLELGLGPVAKLNKWLFRSESRQWQWIAYLLLKMNHQKVLLSLDAALNILVKVGVYLRVAFVLAGLDKYEHQHCWCWCSTVVVLGWRCWRSVVINSCLFHHSGFRRDHQRWNPPRCCRLPSCYATKRGSLECILKLLLKCVFNIYLNTINTWKNWQRSPNSSQI